MDTVLLPGKRLMLGKDGPTMWIAEVDEKVLTLTRPYKGPSLSSVYFMLFTVTDEELAAGKQRGAGGGKLWSRSLGAAPH